jgi:hypothetical protein
MRTGLHRILGNAMTSAGIEPEHVEQSEYGDGVLVLLRPQVSKARLLHPLLPRLLILQPHLLLWRGRFLPAGRDGRRHTL